MLFRLRKKLLTYQLLVALSVSSKTQSVSSELSEKENDKIGPVRFFNLSGEVESINENVPAYGDAGALIFHVYDMKTSTGMSN